MIFGTRRQLCTIREQRYACQHKRTVTGFGLFSATRSLPVANNDVAKDEGAERSRILEMFGDLWRGRTSESY